MYRFFPVLHIQTYIQIKTLIINICKDMQTNVFVFTSDNYCLLKKNYEQYCQSFKFKHYIKRKFLIKKLICLFTEKKQLYCMNYDYSYKKITIDNLEKIKI